VSRSLEFFHGLQGKFRHGMVLCSVVVNLMNRYYGVHNLRLSGFLVDDRLDNLVHVMVPVLSDYCWQLRVRMCCRLNNEGVLEVRCKILGETFGRLNIVVLEMGMLLWKNVVGMLSWKSLGV